MARPLLQAWPENPTFLLAILSLCLPLLLFSPQSGMRALSLPLVLVAVAAAALASADASAAQGNGRKNGASSSQSLGSDPLLPLALPSASSRLAAVHRAQQSAPVLLSLPPQSSSSSAMTSALRSVAATRGLMLLLLSSDPVPSPCAARQLNKAYGHDFMITPNFDKFADSALVFDRAFCNFAICRCALCSVLLSSAAGCPASGCLASASSRGAPGLICLCPVAALAQPDCAHALPLT